MDGVDVATAIFSSLLKAHLGITPDSLQFGQRGDWTAWLQHVEALLAHPQDHDEGETPDATLREGVAAVAMTVELLVLKREPTVDMFFLLKQLAKGAST